MNKVLLVLGFICFSGALYAQTIPSIPKSTKSIKAPSISNVQVKQMQAAFDTDKAQDLVKEQLVKNTDLRDKSIDFLKNNPDTAVSMASIVKKSGGIKSKIIGFVLKNPELTKTAMNYIKNNPEILKKVMGLIGM